MTIAGAQRFIEQVVTDEQLVGRINSASDSQAVRQILFDLDFCFNHEDFDKAYYNVLTACQTYGQAEIVKGIKLWWDCLGYSLGRSE